jgi:hypothetical protein
VRSHAEIVAFGISIELLFTVIAAKVVALAAELRFLRNPFGVYDHETNRLDDGAGRCGLHRQLAVFDPQDAIGQVSQAAVVGNLDIADQV